ncbi:hypothetical protein X777_06239 [Ooceraea biroi]|uniref:Uncharacterized protein n=1 Tax=Ooceraea biroi TaxID=2015173 RepID=A0A026WAT5_OOCBI|nr:hypothetical protein X777_06239 [Ooceraea biroi]
MVPAAYERRKRKERECASLDTGEWGRNARGSAPRAPRRLNHRSVPRCSTPLDSLVAWTEIPRHGERQIGTASNTGSETTSSVAPSRLRMPDSRDLADAPLRHREGREVRRAHGLTYRSGSCL